MVKKRASKLTIHRETLRRLGRTGLGAEPDTSCRDSCYFVSCDGGCGISEGAMVR